MARVVLITLLASSLTPLTTHAQESGDRPTIVFMMADDLGYGDLGA